MKKGGVKHYVSVKKSKLVQRELPVSDYLKYYRVARYWMKKRYGMNNNDLEVLLYLYSEGFFSRDKFRKYENIFSWERNRFDRLLSNKWIHPWRKAAPGQHAIYELSIKGKRAMASFYKKLEGSEAYPMTRNRNPLLDPKNRSFTDKVYTLQMRKVNKENKK